MCNGSTSVGILYVLSFGKARTREKGGGKKVPAKTLLRGMEELGAHFRHLPALEIGRSSASRWRIPTIAQGDVLTINPVFPGAEAPIPSEQIRTRLPEADPESTMSKRVLAGRCFGRGNTREIPLIPRPLQTHLHNQLLRNRVQLCRSSPEVQHAF